MISSKILNKKSARKLNYKWLNSLKINRKIALGYGVALGISFVGTLLGVIIGNHWEQKALQEEQKSLMETSILHRLQIGILQVRTHQQQLIPLSYQPESFEDEYSHII